MQTISICFFLQAIVETLLIQFFFELDLFGRCEICIYNAKKTKCIPLGAAAHNSALLEEFKRKYGQNFIPPDAKFSALRITDLISLITSVYEEKLSKISIPIRSWKKRNLTVLGKV